MVEKIIHSDLSIHKHPWLSAKDIENYMPSAKRNNQGFFDFVFVKSKMKMRDKHDR